MAAIRHLTKAPIVEALVDFRIQVPSGSTEERLRAAATGLQARYPKVEERRGQRTQFEFSPDGSTSTNLDLGLVGLVLTSSDGKRLVQLRADGFTFNRLRPYTSWDEICPEALEAWGVYWEAQGKPRVTRVAIRYVNLIELVGGQAIGEGFKLLPQLPEGFPARVHGFGFRLIVDGETPGSFANVGADLQPGSADSKVRLLFDIDASCSETSSEGVLDIAARLDELRVLKNRIFFSSLSEQLLGSLE